MIINNNSVYLLFITRKDEEILPGKIVVYIAGIFTSPELANAHLQEIKIKHEIISNYVREVRVNHPEFLVSHFTDQKEE